eukprot:jgi/Galph1/4665/GphlegSOOS_G3411.1
MRNRDDPFSSTPSESQQKPIMLHKEAVEKFSPSLEQRQLYRIPFGLSNDQLFRKIRSIFRRERRKK